MNEGTVHGERVSDERIQAWADEAEAGCGLRALPRPAPGHPLSGWESGIVAVSLGMELPAALMGQAEEGGTASRIGCCVRRLSN